MPRRSARLWVSILCVAAACSDVEIVTVEIASIELDPPSASILLGDSVRIQARVLDQYNNLLSGRDIEWSSSDPARASVDPTGLVRGMAPGHAMLTAASGPWQATAEVTVNRPAPTLVSAQPTSGRRQQTLDLALTGSNFQDNVTIVDLGPDIAIDDVDVTGPESITVRVTIPAGAMLGARDVSVSTPSPGGGTATLRSGFTVLAEHPAPTLTSVSPAAAQRDQAIQVTLGGSGFDQGLTSVSFGTGISVETIDVASPTSLSVTVRIDAGAPLGARAVSVTNPAPGGGTAVLAGGFTVLAENPVPTLASASPGSGQRRANLDVTLTGSGFVPNLTTVSFGPDITVNTVQVNSPTSLKANISIGAAAALGARAVSASNGAPGGGTASLPGGFTVQPANPVPAVTGASPNQAQRRTTLGVTLTGSGFLSGLTAVSFGPDVTVNTVAVQSSTALTATVTIAAAAALGPRAISVTNPAPGGGSFTLASGFTVLAENPVPAIASASPGSGQRRDNLDVTLGGSGFVPNLTTVSFGPDVTINSVQVNSPTSLTANIRIGGAATLGARDVSVANPAPGGGTAVLAGGFTVLQENPAPGVTLALPDFAAAGVTTNVLLTGSGFVQGLTSVSFGPDITVNSVNVVFWTSLIANITIAPNAAKGTRHITVSNPPPGGGTFIMNDGFDVR
ncbi:MAG TPA: Ig-like domain-containing protein [Longimicrobiales bacterium]|nr:Ig-like domain-containing protein [Longimicrobiales bacterium]